MDNFVEIWYFTGQNVLFWRGSIKRPDLPTGYRYRTESFNVDSNVIGRSTCAVTTTDIMRVSHSWTPKLNILEILTHFWPASEPCRQATITDMDFMFPVPALPFVSQQRCKYEVMNTQSLATVLCQISGQFRWNLVLYGPKCPILKGVHQTARSPNGLYIQDWIIQRRFQYDRAICSYKVWPYAGQSQLDAKIEYSWNFKNIFDLHRSPVDRQPLMIWTLCFLCLPCLPLPIDPGNIKAWTCTA